MHSLDAATGSTVQESCPVRDVSDDADTGRGQRYKTPRQHVRRAVRTLKLSAARSAMELWDGLKRSGFELRNAAKSAREVWLENR